jgi:alkylation response protein AidB-like acyl-CoA dehydrogenase
VIDLIPDAGQQAVADSVVAFLKGRLPVERHIPRMRQNHPHEHEMWPEIAGIGCFGLSIPEEDGGVGLSLAEEALAFREYGRHLVSPSILATVLAAQLAHASGGHEAGARLVDGTRRAALAIGLPGATLQAGRADGEYQLFDARESDMVLAWTLDGLALFEPSSFAAAEDVRCTDDSVALKVAMLADAKPVHWSPGQDAPLALNALVLVSALLTGIAEAERDMAVLHATTRKQFGQLIGGFQAIKHRCADMALRAEAAWSQTVYAALSVRAGAPDAAFQAATAKLIATRAALEGGADNIQTHGGMGFTAEIAAHLYLKRAHLLNQVGGNVRHQQSRLLALPR